MASLTGRIILAAARRNATYTPVRFCKSKFSFFHPTLRFFSFFRCITFLTSRNSYRKSIKSLSTPHFLFSLTPLSCPEQVLGLEKRKSPLFTPFDFQTGSQIVYRFSPLLPTLFTSFQWWATHWTTLPVLKSVRCSPVKLVMMIPLTWKYSSAAQAQRSSQTWFHQLSMLA